MRKNLDQFFDEFMYENEFAKKVSVETLRNYAHVFHLFRKMIPDAELNTIDSSAMIKFFKILQERKRIVGKGIQKQGVKKSTIATYWSKLQCFFQWLKEKKYIQANPFDNLSRPTPNYDNKKFLSKEEVERIITAIHIHHNNNLLILKRNLVLFYILLFCGLRKEEMLLLQVRDIDMEKKQLVVRAENSKTRQCREIPLHSSLIMHLKDYLTARKNYSTPYMIVSNSRDERLTDDGLKHLVQRIKNKSGVHFHLHQLRHTFAVNFLKSSNNIAKLKQLLGHKNISMTLLYLRCLPTNELRGDIEAMSIDKFI